MELLIFLCKVVVVSLSGVMAPGAITAATIALGAKGTYIGRAFVHGLGAMGEAGVTTALEVIHKELDYTMAFCGHRDVNKVDKDILLVPKDFSGDWA